MNRKENKIRVNNEDLPTGKGLRWDNVYFIGIGGIGMSALARYFKANGKNIAGCDKTATTITASLGALGIKIYFEDLVENIPLNFLSKEKTLVVFTPAISKNHAAYTYFKKERFTILKRAEVLGKITENTYCLAVAGTHGKTTTSSILGHIMQPSKATSFLGGIAENYNSNLILGEDAISVVEADEFDRSFLQLSPNIACITSMDADHLDIYGAHDELIKSFNDFSSRVTGKMIVAKGLPIEGLTYAIEEDADYRAFNLKIEKGTYIFDVQTPTEIIENIALSLPGKHNVMNALVALALANEYGIPLTDIKQQIKTFKGVQRRFTYMINTEELVLIDDYAHHPTAIHAVVNSVREMYPDEKVLAVFQPHLFSRTQDFVADFAKELSKFDALLLLDIYPAREVPIEGVNSTWLLNKVELEKKKLVSKENLIKEIKNSEAKVIVMLGAGDIGILVNEVVKELKTGKK
jgi:UDP-N-acetylmuramate--alanine ligase